MSGTRTMVNVSAPTMAMSVVFGPSMSTVCFSLSVYPILDIKDDANDDTIYE